MSQAESQALGVILCKMLQAGMSHELKCSAQLTHKADVQERKRRFFSLRNALARIRTQYHLH
jgi:hypothetical protein